MKDECTAGEPKTGLVSLTDRQEITYIVVKLINNETLPSHLDTGSTRIGGRRSAPRGCGRTWTAGRRGRSGHTASVPPPPRSSWSPRTAHNSRRLHEHAIHVCQ